MTPRQIFENHISSRFPAGVFDSTDFSPNFSICVWVENSVKTFFKNNSAHFKLETPYFFLIQSDTINGCAFSKNGYNFIGLTKGLVDYSSFIFRNILLNNDFLSDILESNTDQNSFIIHNEVFTSWKEFCKRNNLSFDSLDYTPNSNDRRIIAEALSQYFIFFTIVHELGHLLQRNPQYLFELDASPKNKEDNLNSQIMEMDADKFAVNQLANHLITAFSNRNLPTNTPYLTFFKNQKMIVRYNIFILNFMFYFFAHNRNFEKYFLEYPHPHPALRFSYSSRLLTECFYQNSFLSKDELLECYRQSIHDFGNTIQKIFPNSKLKDFFNLIKDKELHNHHSNLLAAAKSVKNLNGQY